MTEHYPTRLKKSTLHVDQPISGSSAPSTIILDRVDLETPASTEAGLGSAFANDGFANNAVASTLQVPAVRNRPLENSLDFFLPRRRRKASVAVVAALAIIVVLFVALTVRSEPSSVVESSGSELEVPISQQTDPVDVPQSNALAGSLTGSQAGVVNPGEDSDVVAMPGLLVGEADQLARPDSEASTTENPADGATSPSSESTTQSQNSTSTSGTTSQNDESGVATTETSASAMPTSRPPSQTNPKQAATTTTPTSASSTSISKTSASSTPTSSSTAPTTSSPATSIETTSTPTTSTPTTSTTAAPSTTSVTQPGSGQVVWQDNFDQLNAATWSQEHSTYGDGNNELQCYRPENVSVRNGKLVLKAVTETYTCPGGDTRGVTSGMIRSKGVTFSPGQSLEFRVKLTPADPTNQGGLWPAVWSSGWGGGGWPRGGELDYIEVMTAEDPNRVMSSLHYSGLDGTHEHQNKPSYLGENFSADWHVIRFDYGQNGVLVWWLDGRESFRVDSAATIQGYPAPFDQQIGEIKINLALGGNPGPLASGALGTGTSGATFEVDYIRIIQN